MNLRHLLTIARYALLVAVVFGSAVVISSCDDDDGPTKFNGTILEMIQSEKYQQAAGADPDVALDSLVKYLTVKDNTLADLLGGTTQVTLFAPSNAAFAALLETPGFPDNIEDISPSLIANVLSYHIIEGTAYKKADITEANFTTAGVATKYSSVNPCTGASTAEVIKVNADGTLLTGSSNNAIDLVKTNLEADNGVVHITESVMIPPTTGSSLTQILGTITATILLGADFEYLAMAVIKADCGVAGVTPIQNILANSAGTYTAFLPVDAVFDATAKVVLANNSATGAQLIGAFTAAQWRSIILNHIIATENANSALTNGAQLTTMLSGTAKLTVATGGAAGAPPLSPIGKYLSTSGGTTGLGGTTQAPIWSPDIDQANGVVHVVGKILIPN
jgi:uncharacterized surface protein with fasciclin (FAS1) repeats